MAKVSRVGGASPEVLKVLDWFKSQLNQHQGDPVVEESHDEDGGFYRVHASGFIEQGGVTNCSIKSITFTKPFTSANYVLAYMPGQWSTDVGSIDVCYYNKTATSVSMQGRFSGGGQGGAQHEYTWLACGY